MARFFRGWSALAVVWLVAVPATAQQPVVESYRAVVRYSIEAGREDRVVQFRELQDFLKSSGFVASPKEDAHLDAFDPRADRFEGTVPANRVVRLLADARVRSLYLEPANTPTEKPVVAQISAVIQSGLELDQQRQLHEQVVAQLAKLGFRENIGYDHVNFSRVRGSIPGTVLPSLVKDLRGLPAGWFAPSGSKSELPLPIRVTNPLRIVEWLPSAPDTTASIPADVARGKFAADLVKAMGIADGKDQPIRVEMLFDGVPAFSHAEIADRIHLVCPSGSLEGVVGQSAVVRVGKMADAPGLANLPEVKYVRTARAISETAIVGNATKMTAIPGLDAIHKRGLIGTNVRVAIIATGFPEKDKISGNVAYVDLTGELSSAIESAPIDPRYPGSGTATALAVRAAAPKAELILVRIDPYAFHQLITVALATTGQTDSDAMQVRLKELTRDSASLTERRKVVMDEYTTAIKNISDDEKPTQRRTAAKAAYDRLRTEETAFQARFNRYKIIREGLLSLGGTTVIVNTVVSEVGQPHDGLSALNTVIGEKFTPKPHRSAIKASTQRPLPVWVQAAGNAAQSVWAGPFADADGNGVMEFTADKKSGSYTTELAAIALHSNGQVNTTLAANTAIRITAQWREPIEPDSGIDYSLFPITLKLVKLIGSDEVVEVARAASVPVRIHRTLTAGVFEQTLEFTIAAQGKYALRVEGRKSDSIRASRMPEMQITPRIVIEAGDAATATKGVLGFDRQLARSVGVGIPGESTSVITVGTVGGQVGAGPGISLLPKPDVLAAASVTGSNVVGSAVSAGYVGGTVACLAGAGFRPKNLPQTLGLTPGSELKLTDLFLSSIPR